MAAVTLALGVVAFTMDNTGDRTAKFLAHCQAAGFSDQQCAFLHAMDRRRAEGDGATNTAATLR